jgi:UDP-N-acetylmuramate--alanine ligase
MLFSFANTQSFHFVGVGGIGMSTLAHALLEYGYKVSGSDIKRSVTVTDLVSQGLVFFMGHATANIGHAEVIVYSSAINTTDNIEIVVAKQRNIPVIHRSELLQEIFRGQFGIAIAGTHGKTTTTSLLYHILKYVDQSTLGIIGGTLHAPYISANPIKITAKNWVVAEADESDGSFHKLRPIVGLVHNIDEDHMDFYSNMDRLVEYFASWVSYFPYYGCLALNADHPYAASLSGHTKARVCLYGIDSAIADVTAIQIEPQGLETSFTVVYKQQTLGRLTLPLMGKHNVYNTLGAVAIALYLQCSWEQIQMGLATFRGVDRRCTVLNTNLQDSVLFVDDYAHNPVKIQSFLHGFWEALQHSYAKIVSAKIHIVLWFQPHRYTRLANGWLDFITALTPLPTILNFAIVTVCVLPVYSAGEAVIVGKTHTEFAMDLQKTIGHMCSVIPVATSDTPEKLCQDLGLQNGQNTYAKTIVVALGAGDVNEWLKKVYKFYTDCHA